MTELSPETSPQFPLRDYRVDSARRAVQQHARRTVTFVALGLLVLSVLPWVFFRPGPGVRPSLGYAALVLTVLALLLLLRVLLIVRKADRYVAADGAMLGLSPEGIIVAGDTVIPWLAVSGVWAHDTGGQLRARAEQAFFGTPGALMLKAGLNTANITVGITDARLIHDPGSRVKKFSVLPNDMIPARIEIPFGSQFDTAALHDAFAVLRWALPSEVPVRIARGALDYAAAWAGTADDVTTIRAREAADES